MVSKNIFFMSMKSSDKEDFGGDRCQCGVCLYWVKISGTALGHCYEKGRKKFATDITNENQLCNEVY
jgi:hypothetical protein